MDVTTDADAIRSQQRATWDCVSAGWRRWQPEFERGACQVTARLLELAEVAPGWTVLDIGTGTGEPALTAAAVVGPAGRVVGVDLSPAMIAAARAAADSLCNVEFVMGDLESAPLPPRSFDVALSRWGLMFAADRVELLRVTAGLLKPGGVLAAAVWGAPADAPIISLAFRVISDHLALPPPPPGPGPFTMADRAVLAFELEQAGFIDVEVHDQVVPFRFASLDDYATFSRDVLPPGMRQLLLNRCGSLDDPEVWGAFAVAARAYETGGGAVLLPSTCWCVRATVGGRE